MSDRPIVPGDLVFCDDTYLNLIYSDAFNHKHSTFNRPFLVLGKHQNCPNIVILAPVSSKFFYNYAKLDRRRNLRVEETGAPSVVLISNNALQTQSVVNGAVLLDQSIAAPLRLLSLYRSAYKDYVIDSPKAPVKPLIAASDPKAKIMMQKYTNAVKEWEKCSDKNLFLPKININWFVTNGKSVVKHLAERGKMDFDIELSLGCAFTYSNPQLLDF